MHWTVAQWTSMALLTLAFIANLRASFLKRINREWRWLYMYRTYATGLLLGYGLLLLFEVVKPTEYAALVQWLFPVFFLSTVWAPMLHIWEEKAIRSIGSGVGSDRHTTRWTRFRRWLTRDAVHPSQNSERSESDFRSSS